ncbi:DUF3027 domain-containing protein [Arthrobacter sp. JSM 101049]|uniref:DUF3027 domain-containing protein n=1 Tax=Arthrobacter sp. JSM 101049 TaxID=929097 RepID=UPI003568EBED
MARAPKLDAVLGAGIDLARSTLLGTVDASQVGAHLGATADADRVLTHRFEAKLAGYAGWNWYVTLARVPRGKVPTVCETGLLPGDGALLAPDWVPWADRVRPEEREAQQAAEAAAADGTESAKPTQDPSPETSEATHDDGAPTRADAAADAGSEAPAAEAGTDVETVDTAASPDEPDEVVEDDAELVDAEQAAEAAPRRSRSRRRRR